MTALLLGPILPTNPCKASTISEMIKTSYTLTLNAFALSFTPSNTDVKSSKITKGASIYSPGCLASRARPMSHNSVMVKLAHSKASVTYPSTNCV